MQTTSTDILYAGGDLHGNNVFLSICDQLGREVFKRRVTNSLDAVNAAMAPYWGRIKAMGVESTFNWYWLIDGLRDQGHEVRLGNPAKMKQYTGLKATNDASDARWIAEQLRVGVFPECYIYPREIRCVRDALRRRQLFVRRRTQAVLCFQGLLSRYGLTPPGSQKLLAWGSEQIEATGLEPFVQLQLRELLKAARHDNDRAQQIETAVLEFVKPSDDHKQIQQVPGIGKILGLSILLESGAFTRFKNAGCYASYCRTVKSHRDSNGKKKGENNSRNGNAYLAWAFIEAATFASRYYPDIQSWYDKKKKQRNVIVAKKALAAKLAKAVWHVMNGEPFEMGKMF